MTSSQFERVPPLQGGNNFRDFGGYSTIDNRKVRTGKLYRSGNMTSLTLEDQQLLDNLGITTVVDLRSREETSLYPTHWASNSGLNLVFHDYSIKFLYDKTHDENGNMLPIEALYRVFHQILAPQLTLYFEQLLKGSPLVVNCSAGQDRTGVAVALVLSLLGVPRETIIEDYLLSTVHRRPENERLGANLSEHADNNEFARLMLRYNDGDHKPKPLITEDGAPYLQLTLETLDKEYGGPLNYTEEVIGISEADVIELKRLYIE